MLHIPRSRCSCDLKCDRSPACEQATEDVGGEVLVDVALFVMVQDGAGNESCRHAGKDGFEHIIRSACAIFCIEMISHLA